MNPSIIHPDYLARVTRLYGLAPEAVAQLLMHFLMGTSLWLASAQTKVDTAIIKQLSRSAWRAALRPDRGPRYWPRGSRHPAAPEEQSTTLSLDHLTVLADMHRMNADEAAIRTYLNLIGTTWEAAHEQLDHAAARSATPARRSAPRIAAAPNSAPKAKIAARTHQRRSGRDYYFQAVDVHGLSPGTARNVLRLFSQSTPMATVSAETGVDITVLNRLFSLPWWNAIALADRLSAPRPAQTAQPAPSYGPSPAVRALIHELKALHLPAKVIRSYLQIDDGTWKQTTELPEHPGD